MLWMPSVSAADVHCAVPPPPTFVATETALQPVRTVPLSVNCIVPVPIRVDGTDWSVTVAVKVTELLGEVEKDGFRLDPTTVVVGSPTAVVKFRHQPPVIDPPLMVRLSAYSVQVPFGLMPAYCEVKVPIPRGDAETKLLGAPSETTTPPQMLLTTSDAWQY